MTAPLFGLFGALCAVGAETIFAKYGSAGWFRCFLFTFPLQAGISYSIFRVVQADSILAVPIMFGGATAALRIISTLWLGQEVSEWTWAAYGLTLGALALKITGEFWE